MQCSFDCERCVKNAVKTELHFIIYKHLVIANQNTKFSAVCFFCLEPPSFVQKPDAMDVLTGANVTFTSIIKGTPPFSVSWFKGSSELVPGDRCNVSLEESVAELELFDVDTSQSGEYTCIVTNEAGKASCTTHLHVKGLSDAPHLRGEHT